MATTIRNIVFAAPDGDWVDDHWEGGQRALAAFWADLLGWRVIREDWPVVAADDTTLPRLAFGDGPTERYEPPRWGDPDHPQQMHIDLRARDLAAAEDHAKALGATTVHADGSRMVLADPVGHPFSITADADAGDRAVDGRIACVVIDCFSPRALAPFYAELLGMDRWIEDTAERVTITAAGERSTALAFQHAMSTPPRWPDPRYPQQIHLDLHAEDAAAAADLALRLGAIRLRDMGGSCAVFADPAAHPFCLCAPGQ